MLPSRYIILRPTCARRFNRGSDSESHREKERAASRRLSLSLSSLPSSLGFLLRRSTTTYRLAWLGALGWDWDWEVKKEEQLRKRGRNSCSNKLWPLLERYLQWRTFVAKKKKDVHALAFAASKPLLH